MQKYLMVDGAGNQLQGLESCADSDKKVALEKVCNNLFPRWSMTCFDEHVEFISILEKLGWSLKLVEI